MRRNQPIAIDINGISADLVYHKTKDQDVKSLVVDFGEGCRMLSTTCGCRVLRYAANHYIPQASWEHDLDYDAHLQDVYWSMQLDPKDAAMPVTGEDMDNYSYKHSQHGELKVGCFATAGTKGNALRMGSGWAPGQTV